tara:strand:- start:17993 stop:18925 length:933 start_codon:yes stop_codon:yes gene_type:complete
MPDSFNFPKIKFQKTISREVVCNGVGLHSGALVDMKILPAKANEGISFIRTDLPSKPEIKACYKNVCDTKLGTTLCNFELEDVKVRTVEHLMAAFMGLGIDNAKVLLSDGEVPIMDGSSGTFVKLLVSSGIQEQLVSKKIIKAIRSFSLTEDNCFVSIEPSKDFIVDYKIDFSDSAIGVQSKKVKFSSDVFEKDISSARTFGMLNEVENLHKNGLALGGSIDNAIVVDNGKILNPGGLRYKDEFVRHKILDLCGDTYLAGKPIQGHINAFCSGHKLNNKFLLEFLDDRKNYEIIDSITLIEKKEASLAIA